MKSPHQSARRGLAFTLTELLVVIGIIGLLAAILLPVLSSAKKKGRQTTCLSNLKQLGVAFALYTDHYEDTFPAPGSRFLYGPQAEDWIWWQPGRDVSRSSIVPFISRFNPSLFRCPQDDEAVRLANAGPQKKVPYVYSYSLTSYDLEGDTNPGMSTIITKKTRKRYPFKTSQVKDPSGKIMLVDEDRGTIDDSRWVPMESRGHPNLISKRHEGKGWVVFADSHSELQPPAYGQNDSHSKPTQ